eukprot:4548524-Amphidinium_carterae.2
MLARVPGGTHTSSFDSNLVLRCTLTPASTWLECVRVRRNFRAPFWDGAFDGFSLVHVTCLKVCDTPHPPDSQKGTATQRSI